MNDNTQAPVEQSPPTQPVMDIQAPRPAAVPGMSQPISQGVSIPVTDQSSQPEPAPAPGAVSEQSVPIASPPAVTEQPAPAPAQPVANPMAIPARPASKPKAPIGVIVAAIVIAVLVAVLAVVAFLRSKDSSNDTKKPAASQTSQKSVSANDVSSTTQEIDSALNGIDDAKDLSTTSISDTALGL